MKLHHADQVFICLVQGSACITQIKYLSISFRDPLATLRSNIYLSRSRIRLHRAYRIYIYLVQGSVCITQIKYLSISFWDPLASRISNIYLSHSGIRLHHADQIFIYQIKYVFISFRKRHLKCECVSHRQFRRSDSLQKKTDLDCSGSMV